MIKTVHSYWAYLVLLILLLAVINAVAGFIKKKEFTHKDFRISLLALIMAHMQLLIGLVVYLANGWYSGLGEMKNAGLRLLALEHPLMMILALVLITIGWSKHKKQVKSASKFKTLTIFYGLGLVFVLSRLPWSNWLA